MNWMKLLICSVSLCTATATACLIACGWFTVNADEQYTSYFRKDIPDGRNNFFFSYLNFYDTGEEEQSEKKANIEEWKKHLGGTISDRDAEQLIYDIPLAGLQAMNVAASRKQWGKASEISPENSMLQRIAQRNDLASMHYLLYARACEQQAGRRSEDWNRIDFDPQVQDSLLRKGIQLYSASKSAFLRMRYAFQVVRMAFYLYRNSDCVAYYKKMVEPVATNAQAKLWAMSFYAGAVSSDAEALYCYSKVFDRCPRYSHAAMLSVRRMTGKADTSGMSALCKNRVEKAALYAMTGFTCFHPTLEPLARVYEQNPASPYLESLLIREINKAEALLENGDRTDILKHIQELQAFAVRCAGLKTVERPVLWYTAAAYLSCLSEDPKTAALLVNIAEEEQKQYPPDPKVREQLLAVQLLTETHLSIFDTHTENRILPSLEWLLSNLRDTTLSAESHAFFDRTAAHYFAEKLPDIFLKRQQPVRAALCTDIAMRYSPFALRTMPGLKGFAVLDRHAGIPQLETMLEQLSSSAALSGIDSFLYRYSPQSESAMLELIGTKHLRALRFKEAENYFIRQHDASPLFHLNSDPFAMPPIFGTKPVTAGQQRRHNKDSIDAAFVSKLSFAREMAELQADLHKRPENHFRYACGLFQMSYFGKCWQLASYRWSALDREKWKTVRPEDEMYHYYNSHAAFSAFMEAFDLSRNGEFKAQCLFCAACCYQMTSLSAHAFADKNALAGSHLKHNPFFPYLKEKLSKTAFYKEAVTRCSYFSDFVRQELKNTD
ncbi:MAG: hypothetical protein LBS03_08695 [Bacteroidales bacterium]|jgi:hypothetical protein|nr:hypothetical protein [Bacteroidales bacterium]